MKYLLLLLLIPFHALADRVDVTWDAPAFYEDKTTPLTQSAIKGYKIYISSGGSVVDSFNVDTGVLSYNFDYTIPGDYVLNMTTITVDRESVYSIDAPFQIAMPEILKPGTPGNVNTTVIKISITNQPGGNQ